MQYLPNKQLEQLDNVYKYSMMAKDTLRALVSIELRANAYELLNMTDSVVNIRRRVNKMYNKYGYKANAALSLGPLVLQFAKQKQYHEAKKCMDIYEAQSGIFDDNGNVDSTHYIYNYAKGFYLLGMERFDSAEIYFRKVMGGGLQNRKRQDIEVCICCIRRNIMPILLQNMPLLLTT